MRDALLHIARKFEADGDGVQRDADLLEAAMAGMGTKDERLYVPPSSPHTSTL
jgi:annexin A7/11